jgi:hypothetical protein
VSNLLAKNDSLAFNYIAKIARRMKVPISISPSVFRAIILLPMSMHPAYTSIRSRRVDFLKPQQESVLRGEGIDKEIPADEEESNLRRA